LSSKKGTTKKGKMEGVAQRQRQALREGFDMKRKSKRVEREPGCKTSSKGESIMSSERKKASSFSRRVGVEEDGERGMHPCSAKGRRGDEEAITPTNNGEKR